MDKGPAVRESKAGREVLGPLSFYLVKVTASYFLLNDGPRMVPGGMTEKLTTVLFGPIVSHRKDMMMRSGESLAWQFS